MPFVRFFCLAVAFCLAAGTVFAHGDAEKPLFVAADGNDAGRCKDPQQPCQTLGYALGMAGKGARIRVASGSFAIASSEDLFMLVSGTVELRGGYRNDGEFKTASGQATFLTGVPPEYRDLLSGKGFNVIADTKGHDPERSAEAQKLLTMYDSTQVSMSAAPCTNGFVNGLPCNSVDLLSHMAFSDISARPAAAADVWGFVDLNSDREYAITGFYNGTAVIDVTDPANPREVGYIRGQSTTWRDIKVYQSYDDGARRWKAYAYVTSDNASEGLFVIDLSGLPHYVQKLPFVSDFGSAHNVYASNTDYGTGISLSADTPNLVIAGSSIGRGQFRIYSLADPESPQFVGTSSSAGYMHDASSMKVSDARASTQCINATSDCDVLFDFNENQIEIWDISNVASPQLLGSSSYTNAFYVHSGWWSEDKQYLFAHDELDEQRAAPLPTTVRVFSLANLRNPTLVGSWSGPTRAIDHNGFVRGNRYYMSNYSRGLTILDISNPATPVTVGNLDTYTVSDSSSFVGAWGAYPYFHSGTIAISDISSGFYLADDMTRQVAQGSFAVAESSYSVTEGGQATITIQRLDGASGNVSVGFELIGATADAADYSALATLNWSSGDSTPKTISLSATSDGAQEDMEQVLLRLIAPQGGATLARQSTTNIFISDAGATPSVELLEQSVGVAERGLTRAVIVLNRSGSAVGPVSVNIDMTDGDATPGNDFSGNTSATVSWPDGDANPKTLEFDMVDDGDAESTEFFTLALSNPVGASLGARDNVTVFIGNGNGINQPPSANAGASQVRIEQTAVTLDGGMSSDPNGDGLSYAWTQTLGPAVSLANANTAIATFTAPSVSSDILLQFRLTVTDPFGRADSATVTVTVRDSSSSQNNNGGGSGFGLLILLLLAATYLRPKSLRRTGAA